MIQIHPGSISTSTGFRFQPLPGQVLVWRRSRCSWWV